jgi:hypothetical protein
MPPKLVITIDTEEDLWGEFRVENNPVLNVQQLPRLHALLARYGAIPTYLVNWAVVSDDDACRTLIGLRESGVCEFGAHCHPWNTPPFEETPGPFNSMLCNLPSPLVRQKLSNLHKRISDRLGVAPRSFRAGRWGLNEAVASSLHELGYTIDTSVSPGVDWAADFGPDFSRAPIMPYRFDPASVGTATPTGVLVEVPPTIGFLQPNYRWCAHLRRALLASNAARSLHVTGLLDRTHLLNFRWLSPELSDADDMIRLAKRFIRDGASMLNMCFHSNALLPGVTPFVKNGYELESFLGRISRFLEFAAENGIRFSSLSASVE